MDKRWGKPLLFCVSADARWYAVEYERGTIIKNRIGAGRPMELPRTSLALLGAREDSCTWSPGSTYLATMHADDDSRVTLIEPARSRRRHVTLPGLVCTSYPPLFSPDEQVVAVSFHPRLLFNRGHSIDATVAFIDLRTNERPVIRSVVPLDVGAYAWVPEDRVVLAVSWLTLAHSKPPRRQSVFHVYVVGSKTPVQRYNLPGWSVGPLNGRMYPYPNGLGEVVFTASNGREQRLMAYDPQANHVSSIAELPTDPDSKWLLLWAGESVRAMVRRAVRAEGGGFAWELLMFSKEKEPPQLYRLPYWRMCPDAHGKLWALIDGHVQEVDLSRYAV